MVERTAMLALLCGGLAGCGGSAKDEPGELGGAPGTNTTRGGASGATSSSSLGGAKPTGTGGSSVKGGAGGATSVTTLAPIGTGTGGGIVGSGGNPTSVGTGGKVSGGAGSGGNVAAGAGAGGKVSAGAGAAGIGAANSAGGITGTSGAGGPAVCAAYKAADARADGLVDACAIASNGWCKATLQEFISAQVSSTTTAWTTMLVEGCGTRSVGWDARLGGKILTFDASGNLVGYRFWNDTPNGPCGNTAGSGTPTFSYNKGTSRSTLLAASATCTSDVVCSMTATSASQVHCPSP